MKKKMLTVVLVLALALSITACGGVDKEALDLYNEASKNMQTVKDAVFSMDMTMKVKADGQSSDLKISAKGQQVMKSKTDVDMAMDMSMDMGSAGSYDTTIYYTGGYMYMDMMGQKIKSKVDVSTAMQMANSSASSLTLTEDMVESASTKKDGDNTVLEFKIKGDKVNEILKSTAGSAAAANAEYLNSVKSGDMTISAVIDKDKMLKSMKITSALDAEANNETASMEYDVSMKYQSVNTGIKIKFPSFKGYTEQSLGL